jgi:hemoglobin/transferrin/lactoferrin receptor protein
MLTRALPVYSQEHNPPEADSLAMAYLDELVISANRIPEARRSIAQQISVITPATLRTFNAQTSADLIANTGMVTIQKSQQGGGSPVLRGFEASRILLVVDGVRINNLIYRSGHLQNIITMDNNSLDRAEVLFGPSSTIYGSDALGGVIHFSTRTPALSETEKPEVHGGAFVRYATSNNEKAGHLDLTFSGPQVASFTSFTFSDFGDLRMGEKSNPFYREQFGVRNQYVVRSADNTSDILATNEDPFVQVHSGYRQWDLLEKLVFKPGERTTHTLNVQYSNSTNVPRYDRLTDPGSGGAGLRFAEWYYGPQTRMMGSYQLQVENEGSWADRLSLIASFQDIGESRHDRRFNNNFRNDRTEKVNVWGLTVDLLKKTGRNSLRYGIDGQFNTLISTAHKTDITTGAEAPLNTRYPDGDNRMGFLSAFGTHTREISDRLVLNDGLRLGYSALRSTFVDQSFYPFPFSDITQKNFTGSASLGLVYSPSAWKFSLLGSTGFRVPNVDDLAKVFDSQAGDAATTGILIVPNPDLGPEKTLNSELGITHFFGSKARLEGVFFATRFNDIIVVLPSTYNGQSTVLYDGYPADVYSSQNRDKAYLYGFSVNGWAQIARQVSATASYNYTHGRLRNEGYPDTPLDHIPPPFGRIGLQYMSERLTGEFFSNFSGWKHVEDYSSSGEDNLQYATPKGMPAWYTLNLRASYDLLRNLTVQAGVDNILDLQYRTFASGINASGRNFLFTVRGKF